MSDWTPPYRIATERLVLRPPEPGDALEMQQVVADNKAHLCPEMPWARGEALTFKERVNLLRNFRSRFDASEDFMFVMFDRETEALIGATGLHTRIGPQALEIGYWISEQREGQGLVSEAVQALAHVALVHMKALRLEIRCSEGNERSAAVPRRLGFHLDGILRMLPQDGDPPRDTMIWSLVAQEYPDHPLSKASPPQLLDAVGGAYS